MLVFWGSDVGQSAAAGGNAGYFKIPLILTPFSPPCSTLQFCRHLSLTLPQNPQVFPPWMWKVSGRKNLSLVKRPAAAVCMKS